MSARRQIPGGCGMRLTVRLVRESAYVFGRRCDEVFLQLKALLEPFGIKKYCTDGWGAYERKKPAELHEVGKRKTSENRAETSWTENAHQAVGSSNNLLFAHQN